MSCNIDFIYVEDSNFLINPKYNNLNFKINIIFIINEKNIDKYNYNLLFLLRQQYKSSNIYIFKSNIKLKNIEIIISLTQLAYNNSLILIIDNDYLINPMLSLEFINKLFFSKKILVSDYYSNENINILIFKKELLLGIEVLDNDIKYMNLLYSFLKENSFNQYFLKEYSNFNNIDIEKYFVKKEYNLINNYYEYFFDNYSIEKIYLLNNNLKIFNNISNEYLEKIELYCKNDYNKELNFLLNIYSNNIINYNILLNKLIKNIKNIISENQIIIYIDSNIDNNFYDKLSNII